MGSSIWEEKKRIWMAVGEPSGKNDTSNFFFCFQLPFAIYCKVFLMSLDIGMHQAVPVARDD